MKIKAVKLILCSFFIESICSFIKMMSQTVFLRYFSIKIKISDYDCTHK
jgi:hypothetical protein